MAQSPKSGIRAETSNGSITMELPGNTAARLNAQTSQSIFVGFRCHGRTNSDHEKHHLEGNIGAGGPLIDLSTHNGGIRLRKSVTSTN